MLANFLSLSSRKHRLEILFIAIGLLLFTLAVWLPALFTPWWGDDYDVLQTAKAARISDQPWWEIFWPKVHWGFWRPLSTEAYWRFVEQVLQADSVLAHAANFTLWFFSSALVGLVSCQFAKILKIDNPVLLGLITTSIYGLSSIHFLALHWVSAANSSFIVIFTALSITCWITAPVSNKYVRIILCCLIPLLQLLALFSKESSILIPLLLLVCSLYIFDHIKPGKYEILAWVSSVIVCSVWYLFLKKITESRDNAYDLVLGVNILRNLALLLAWLLNIPREALRMIVNIDTKFIGYIWVLASAIPMMCFLYFTIQPFKKLLSKKQVFAVVLFVGVGYLPYFFLVKQSYEYYAAVAFILPSILISQGLLLSKKPALVAAFFCISSFVAIQGSRGVSYPGLIGRANWAEQQLTHLKSQNLTAPLVVNINNFHQFYAIGISGLSWRLGINEKDILISDDCPQGIENWLIQKQDGNLYLENCPKPQKAAN